jgi:hypothetical protein
MDFVDGTDFVPITDWSSLAEAEVALRQALDSLGIDHRDVDPDRDLIQDLARPAEPGLPPQYRYRLRKTVFASRSRD